MLSLLPVQSVPLLRKGLKTYLPKTRKPLFYGTCLTNGSPVLWLLFQWQFQSFVQYLFKIHTVYKDMGSGALPPSQGPSCLTCRIISLLIFQHRTRGDLGRWPWHCESHEHWELAVTLRGGQPQGTGGLAASETQEEIGHVSCILGECSGKQIVIFIGRGALPDTSWWQIRLLLCLVWSWS